MRRFVLGAALVGLAWAGVVRGQAASQPAAAPVLTQEQIQKLVDDGQYQEALKAIALAMPGVALDTAPSAKRYALNMLRGEAMLQLKMGIEAGTTFGSAAKDGSKPEEKGMAAGMELLIKRSSAFAYTPKATKDKLPPLPAGKTGATAKPAGKNGGATTKPATTKPATTKPAATQAAGQPGDPPPANVAISILDRQQRAAALLGLFYDELIADTSRLKDVKSDPALQATVDFAPTVHTLGNLEWAATQADAYTQGMTDDLTNHAHDLMTKSLATLASSVDGIAKAANQSVPFTVQGTTGTGKTQRQTPKTEYKKHGLNAGDPASLQESIATCGKFADAVTALTTALGAPAKTFAAVLTEADTIKKKATATLNADYTRTYTTPPKGG